MGLALPKTTDSVLVRLSVDMFVLATGAQELVVRQGVVVVGLPG
jgi:hypothetical protein